MAPWVEELRWVRTIPTYRQRQWLLTRDLRLLRRWRGVEKSHRRELARIVTVNSERAVRILKPSSKQKNSFERIPSRPGSACKFADWFSSVFQSLQMHCRVFCISCRQFQRQPNQEIMRFTAKKKKKLHTCSCSGPGISEKTKETKVI